MSFFDFIVRKAKIFYLNNYTHLASPTEILVASLQPFRNNIPHSHVLICQSEILLLKLKSRGEIL